MTAKVYNFSAGPAMLPPPVMEKIREEWLDYKGMGASIIEISHRSSEFSEVLEQADGLFRELLNLPENYEILYVHGGARMQFAGVPMNLMRRSPARTALYVETGNFAKLAAKEADKFGEVVVAASSADTNYDRIPEIGEIAQDASYFHLTSNNTLFGTRWNQFPETGDIPLVLDSTSEILSRELDYSKFGLVYAGLQKNLGPSGMAVVIVRKDLLGLAPKETPTLLDYADYAKNHSLANTANTFAIYVTKLVLQWIKDAGGVKAIEEVNEKKAGLLYSILDKSDFYKSVARPDHRSTMNVTFHFPNDDLLGAFLKEALAEGLYALKGHRTAGGARASIYNAMPFEGVKALGDFMEEFERKNG